MRRKEWENVQWREEGPIWAIGLILFAFLLAVGIVDFVAPGIFFRTGLSCFFWENVGLYCTGCGVTRAVLALVHGHLLQSLYYNVVVLYVVVFYGIYLTRGAVYLISKGKYPFMKFRAWYVIVGLGFAVIQAVVKNVALYVYHYQWMT